MKKLNIGYGWQDIRLVIVFQQLYKILKKVGLKHTSMKGSDYSMQFKNKKNNQNKKIYNNQEILNKNQYKKRYKKNKGYKINLILNN